MKTGCLPAFCLALLLWLPPQAVRGQQNDSAPSPGESAAKVEAERFKKFRESLSHHVLEGHFTVDGQPLNNLKPERYELGAVEKMDQGDYWLFQARIRYGDHDVTVPLPLRVTWADQTAVITLDQVTIPGLGTFDARVMIHDDKYAGTWRHGEAGGLLFGNVVRPDAASQEAARTKESD